MEGVLLGQLRICSPSETEFLKGFFSGENTCARTLYLQTLFPAAVFKVLRSLNLGTPS